MFTAKTGVLAGSNQKFQACLLSRRSSLGQRQPPPSSTLQLLPTRFPPVLHSHPQFWHHCYGPDGSSGTVAAASAAARQVLHQLCCIPLDSVAPGEFCDRLFKGQEDVASALSVRAFLERQRQVLGTRVAAWEGRRHQGMP